MAEIVAGFAGPAIEVVKLVAKPIKRQFNYLCCFTSNIDSLKHEAEKLDYATREVQDQVDIERRNLKDAVPEVITWLDECQKMKERKDTILHEVPNVKEGCLNLKARFSLSRRAKKTVDHMKELLVGKNFNNPIARERPLGATQEVPLGNTYDFVAGFAGPAIEVVKLVAKPIKRQFNYLCCFTSNIDSLKHEAEKLDYATRELHDQLDIDRRNLKYAVPEIIIWLDECQKMKEEKETILRDVPNVKEGCLKLGARFSLSRRARKIIDHIKELLVWKNFNERTLGAAQEIPLGKTYEFKSRTKLEEDIMTTLQNVDVNTIGICGMGGLGKTTMAQRIGNRVLKEHVFEEVAMAVFSQQVDKSKIQVEIGESLGLKNLKDDTSEVRVQKLHARLTGTKRILLILDDVWEGLELESLGIPRDSEGCTILVTSRNGYALSDMDVQKVFLMEILSVEEAWALFRERVGTCVDDAELNSIAKEVVEECGGLPIALTVVGATLKDEKDARSWNDALLQLRECYQDIPNYDARVYNPLKRSYDLLNSKAAKSLLLLYCLFPEDARIPLEDLMYICMGLGIFEGIRNLEGARNRISTLTKMLTSRSLLLSEIWRDERCVRMHDVVRDVFIIIAKHEKYIGGNDCAWISSYELIGERSEFRTELGFPNLRLLLLEKEFKFDSTVFLEGIRDLHVLWIGNSTLTSLPLATQPLKNLQTLVLVFCEGLKTISVVGELVNLKILVCRYCRSLEKLPAEIKRLNRLKLLELTGCGRLQSIGRGIISSLVGLEELKMRGSFRKWEEEDREEMKNAGLRELEALTNLTCLEIEIEDPTLVAENMHISTKLERFHINIDRNSFQNNLLEGFDIYDKKMGGLRLERETCLGHWIEMQLLRVTEYLTLRGNGANKVDFGKIQNMRWLRLSDCDDVDATLFPAPLEHMELYSLPQLQEISFSSFQNLSYIKISHCPRIRNLAKLSIAAGEDCLSQLEKLHIEECEVIEQVLLWKEEDSNRNNSESIINSSHVKFPKLKEVKLVALPNVATFCQGIEGIEFPLLKEIYIQQCPKWKSMVASGISESRENKSRGGGNSSINADIDNDYSSHLFCQSEKVSLGNLKEIYMTRNPFCVHKIPVTSFDGLEMLIVSGYQGGRNLISSSIATNLANLKSLSIFECDEMMQVVKDDDKEDKIVLFPKLEELSLHILPKLVSFCELKCDVVFPSLRKLEIRSCPKMKNFSLGLLAAPNLEDFSTDFNHLLELGVKVSFDRLKILWIKDVRNTECPFYHHKLFISLVYALEKLYLSTHQSMSTLFPFSVAGKLVNLRLLQITDCPEMVKLIEEEEDEEEEVASGSRRNLLFPKLEELKLSNLPKLVSFCERRSGVELPSLSGVGIYDCPNMKHFSSGPLTAPNLKILVVKRT